MKIRKCPKCGGNVPVDNKVCNNCGHTMNLFGGSSTLGGNYQKNNANTIPGGNPFEIKKNNTGIFIVLILIFLFPFLSIIISAVGFIFEEVFSELNATFDDEYYGDLEDDYYFSLLNKCTNYCYEDSENIGVIGNRCYCSNGNIFDENGLIIYDSSKNDDINNDSNGSLDENVNDSNSVNLDGWKNDILSGKTVVTVIAGSYCGYCANYKPIIEEARDDYGFILHYVYLDYLNSEEEKKFLKTFDIGDFDGAVPYTYVMKNKKFVSSNSGYMSSDELYNFLKNNGVI